MDSPKDTEQRPAGLHRAAVGLVLLAALGLVAAGAFMALGRSRTVGRLEVKSTPPGCEVRLDGRFAGTTPLTVADVAPGEHFVEVGRAGYHARVVRVELAAGGSEPVNVELRPLSYGGLQIESQPTGATVELDGESRGNTPLKIEGLRPGAHRLVLRRARHDAWTRTVRVEAGRTAKVSAKLQDSLYRFLCDAIAARPADVTTRADMVHYLRTQGKLDLMEQHAAEGIMLIVGGKAKGDTKYLWLMLYRESARISSGRRAGFLRSLARRVVAACGPDEGLKLKLVAEMIKSTKYSSHRLNRAIARNFVYATAAQAADGRAVVERALDLAAESRSPEQVKGLLDAAAKARPGDGAHIGPLAVSLLNHVKAGRFSGSRAGVLSAAAGVVETALKTGQKDRVLGARLCRLLGRLRLAQDRKKQALAELEKAVAGLKSVGKAEAGRRAAWRLEQAELLLELERSVEAARILKELAAGAPDPEVRRKAAARLRKLAPAPKH